MIKEAMKQIGQIEQKAHEKEKKFGKMMFLLMAMFVFTYLPRFLLTKVKTIIPTILHIC